MYGSEILDLFDLWGLFSLGGTKWLLAWPFLVIPLYPWFQLVFAWCHRHYVVAEGGVIRDSLISVILVGVPLTSRKLHSSRRESSAAVSYPLLWRVFASHHGYIVLPGGGAICHSVTSLILAPVFVAYRKSRPYGRHLRVPNPSVLHFRKCVRYAGTWTGSTRLQFGTSSGGKEVTKEFAIIQIHISEPIRTKLCTPLPLGLEETIGHIWAHNISLFQPFSTYSVWNGCRFLRSWWLPAPHCPATVLYPWCSAYWCDVTGVMCTVRNA
jgi:hypothetical protein